MTYKCLYNASKVYPTYGDGYIPYNVIVDRQGIVRYSASGLSQAAILGKINALATGIEDEETEVSNNFRLNQNYPNPFNSETIIVFRLPSQSFVSLKVYDALGKEVASLISQELSAGTYSQHWSPEGLPSGVYLYRLAAGDYIATKKMLLMK